MWPIVNVAKICSFVTSEVIRNLAAFRSARSHPLRNKSYYPKRRMTGEVPWSSALPGLLDEVWGMRKHWGFLAQQHFKWLQIQLCLTSITWNIPSKNPSSLANQWNLKRLYETVLNLISLDWFLFYYYLFWPPCTTCGILVPWPRDETNVPCIESVES